MAIFPIAFVFSLLIYLFLTAGSGDILIWSSGEIIVGILFSILTAFFVSKILSALEIETNLAFFNPIRWFLLFIYAIGPFFWAMTKANLDVAYRVITGRINPGIVKISPKLKTDLGITLLANSITLTPGTLSVDLDEENNLYVHLINVVNSEPKIEEVCSNFHKWVKRITE
ncbi:MAG: Na+/H+ antiporter subunit E [Candidatus Altiarchaeales archaeon]|nr:Na+/H+ antiporter subunit E [Candidatus Altiarchaeales archaeon]